MFPINVPWLPPLDVYVSVRLKAECSVSSNSAVLRSSNANRSSSASKCSSISSSNNNNTVVICAATAPTELTVAVCRHCPPVPLSTLSCLAPRRFKSLLHSPNHSCRQLQ